MATAIMPFKGTSVDTLYTRQKNMFAAFKSIPASGLNIRHLGVPLVVHRNVFIPCEDTVPLLEKFQIRKGESVLDVGTGSGAIAIFAKLAGARKVVAVDWSEDAVRTAIQNVRFNGLERKIEVRLSDVFSSIDECEKFNVITANLPFMNRAAGDKTESSIWDTDLYANKSFFKRARTFLSEKGRVYIPQADFGAVDEILQLAKNAGFRIKRIGEKLDLMKGSTFYAFELR